MVNVLNYLDSNSKQNSPNSMFQVHTGKTFFYMGFEVYQILFCAKIKKIRKLVFMTRLRAVKTAACEKTNFTVIMLTMAHRFIYRISSFSRIEVVVEFPSASDFSVSRYQSFLACSLRITYLTYPSPGRFRI